MTLFGDVIAHCILAGLSLSFFLDIEIIIGTFIADVLGAGSIFID
jgi:manganese/iron transport system permease protein